ncbi:hypothetical protein MVEN_01597100 [Mycena venus]|uniref:Protein kinase domain-containing protein n=1 Tax=Mycena venus TaxID=2733690 RepID=A0A8H6XPU8_9AGAR|nr:hypothetical protein MVEN_01597100 [Mycena venus]
MHDKKRPVIEASTSRSRQSIVRGTYHAAAINTASRDINIIGSTTNFTYAAAPAVPSDVRILPMGDIDLQHEIHLNNVTGVVDCRNKRASVRRVYSAKLDGRQSTVTVAMYEGHDAEEEWREDIDRYADVRHPNILQIYGISSTTNIRAIVFNDDLIPLEQFLEPFRHSHFMTVYAYARCATDFTSANNYFRLTFERSLFSSECAIWIRRSTQRFCAEFAVPRTPFSFFREFYEVDGTCRNFSESGRDREAIIIDSLPLDAYHEICGANLATRRLGIVVSISTVVNLGTVICCSSDTEPADLAGIASLMEMRIDPGRWITEQWAGAGAILENGWTRFQSADVFERTIAMPVATLCSITPEAWLSQANHIFARLGTTSNFEDYVLVDRVDFQLEIPGTADDPIGFLFVCPPKCFQIGPSSFRWPECPAYWSLDPSGVERLTPYEAMQLGFPTVTLHTTIRGKSWDASVYSGLRQFHNAKGFDPESRAVARHLGHPRFQLASERDALALAHMSEYDWYSSYADDESDYNEASASDWRDEIQVNHQSDALALAHVSEYDWYPSYADDESDYNEASANDWGNGIQVNHQRNHWRHMLPVMDRTPDFWDPDDEPEYRRSS